MVETSVLVSALAGLGSFVSLCILPILPAFISYLSGTSISEIQKSAEYNNGNEIQPTTLQSQNVMGKLQQPFNIKKSARINIFLNTVYFFARFFTSICVIRSSFKQRSFHCWN